MKRSVLYPYERNAAGAWCRFLHVRIQSGRKHPSPADFRSKRDCEHR